MNEAADDIPVGRALVSQTTVRKLQQLITDGTFRPGEKLPGQRELAEMLQISRNSLREAISVLETIGLVKVEVARGVFVSEPHNSFPKWKFPFLCTPQEVYAIRYCIEPFASALASPNLATNDIARLERSVAEMTEAFLNGDIVEMARLDRVFHDTIVAACKNVLIIRTYESIHDVVVETQRIPMSKIDTLRETPEEHAAIVTALKSKNPTKVEFAMKSHISGSARRADIDLALEF